MLAHNWQDIIKRAWSIRLMLLAGLFSGLEVALPLLDGFIDLGRGWFALFSGITVFGAFVSRLIAQQGLTHDKSAE